MAPRPPNRPGLSLLAVLAVIVGLYAAMVGIGHTTPKLGLDLQGGTTVILTPQPAKGQQVTSGQLSTAVDIIRQRVNGLGVSEAQVVRQGTNVVVSVPGKGRSDVLGVVGQTAFLTFREIYLNPATGQPVEAQTGTPPGSNAKSASPSPSPSAPASPSTSPTPKPTASPSPSASKRGRAVARALLARRAASPALTPTPSAAASPAAGATPGTVQTPATGPAPATNTKEADQTAPTPAEIAAFNALDCSQNGGRPKPVDDDIHHFVVACDRSQPIKYLLKPAQIVGTDVASASSGLEVNSQGVTTGAWVVNLTFKDSAITKVETITGRLFNAGRQPLAITLDGVVESAPATDGQLGKNVQISGGSPPFTQKQSSQLANVLKYGSLPVTFVTSSAESISATLGQSSLQAGLLAGAIGLALVLIYVFLYYRALGFVTIASLSVSALMVYASVTLLGQIIGFTLSLAGIAGLIVSVGITADSFVVFFERLKDEMREGRSPRQAVEYGWIRARRTIFTADFVSFLAALILYEVSIGDVRGFAFTLGLSTMLDVVTVVLFTKPLMSMAIRYRTFSTGRFSGLASVGRPSAPATPREA